MNGTKRVLGILSVALSCAALPVRAEGDTDESLRQLSAQWWQWAFSIPAATNPLVDGTGANCMIGQRGPVWFLAGTFTGSTPVARNCTVPEGAALFFPVINSFAINAPDCDGRAFSVAELRAQTAAVIDQATDLSVLLDNGPVKQLRRVRSMVFATTFPRGDVLGAPCIVPGQLYSPSVDDGWYVKLRGLAAGQHTLSIRGAAGGAALDVFYMLNVVKVAAKDLN